MSVKLITVAYSSDTSKSNLNLKIDPVIIETKSGKFYDIEVEIADSMESRQRGLMYRDKLPSNSGMLFVFEEVSEVFFWMKNTLIPLDLIFIGTNGGILNISKNSVPLSEMAIPSKYPVKAVLEVNSGFVDRLGISIGDTIRHNVFNQN